MMMPTLTPSSALNASTAQRLSTNPAPAPAATYSTRALTASRFAVIFAASLPKSGLVRAMNRAGILMTICTRATGSSEKCSLITSKAGATAAPAITVSSDSDSTATMRVLCCSRVITPYLLTRARKSA